METLINTELCLKMEPFTPHACFHSNRHQGWTAAESQGQRDWRVHDTACRVHVHRQGKILFNIMVCPQGIAKTLFDLTNYTLRNHSVMWEQLWTARKNCNVTHFTWVLNHRMVKFATTSFRVLPISHCRALCGDLYKCEWERKFREGVEGSIKEVKYL